MPCVLLHPAARGACSLCVHILRVRYETPSEWQGLIKAQQETTRVGSYNPQVIVDAYKRGQAAGNKARLVVQVRAIVLSCYPSPVH